MIKLKNKYFKTYHELMYVLWCIPVAVWGRLFDISVKKYDRSWNKRQAHLLKGFMYYEQGEPEQDEKH
jgi:hypothetical protein